MNEILNKFLSAGNKFMPDMQLRQPGLKYSICGIFIKKHERMQKSKKNRRFTIHLSKRTR